jgi:hypothetical protein
MALLTACYVSSSLVHGVGLFSATDIAKSTVLWAYNPAVDQKMLIQGLSAEERSKILHYGYINPLLPEWVVVCGDDACYWNFPKIGSDANAVPSVERLHGEFIIIAARDISCGEEMLIDPTSDADYFRKVGLASPNLVSPPWLSRAM